MGKSKAVEPLTEDQKALAAEYVELAETVARLRKRSCLPLEERIQEAYVGLIDAASRFEPARGVKFSTFAVRRIRGAIIDAERMTGTAVVKIKRTARHRGEAEIGVVSVESLNSGNPRGGRGWLASDFLFVDVEPPAEDEVEMRDAIEAAMAGLPAKERTVARSYWLEGKTMKQAGAEVGVVETRVSQMMSKSIIPRLREHRALADFAEVA